MTDIKTKRAPTGPRGAGAPSPPKPGPTRGTSPKPARPPEPADAFDVAPVQGPNRSAPSLPAKVDVTLTSPDKASLEAMKKLPGGRDLVNEIDNVRRNYAPLLKGGARICITSSQGNGDAPVLTFVPKSLVDDPKQPFDVDVHYQGKYGTAAFPDPQGDVQTRLARELDGSPPTVVVLPEPSNYNGAKVPDSKNRGTGEGFSPNWGNAKDPRATAADALKAVGLSPAGMPDRPLIVSAHSAGGRAVANAIANGQFTPNRVRLEDCAYGAGKGKGPSCADAIIAWAKTKDSDECTAVDYVHSKEGGNGEARKLPDKLELRDGLSIRRADIAHHYGADFWPGKDEEKTGRED